MSVLQVLGLLTVIVLAMSPAFVILAIDAWGIRRERADELARAARRRRSLTHWPDGRKRTVEEFWANVDRLAAPKG